MKTTSRIIAHSIIFLAPFILWMMPADFFDSGDIMTCPSVYLFDVECIGCGMTRAFMHFHHFEYPEARFYNAGVFIVYPLFLILWIRWSYIGYQRFKQWKNSNSNG